MSGPTTIHAADARHRIAPRPGPGPAAPSEAPEPPSGLTAPSRPRLRGSRGPDPERLLRLVATVYLEVEAGTRPLAHIEPLLSKAAWERVRSVAAAARDERNRAHGQGRPSPPVGRIHRVRAQRVDDDRWEGVAIVVRGPRAGALALRVERHRGGWRCTEVHAPERGGTALRSSSLPGARRRDAFDEAADEAGEAPTME